MPYLVGKARRGRECRTGKGVAWGDVAIRRMRAVASPESTEGILLLVADRAPFLFGSGAISGPIDWACGHCGTVLFRGFREFPIKAHGLPLIVQCPQCQKHSLLEDPALLPEAQ